MIKKILMLTAVLALLVTKTATAAEIYAVLSSDEETLTFYYDNQKNSRSGKVYDYEYNDKDEWGKRYPKWVDCCETVTKAVFDPSMSSARPADCSYWFADFLYLEQIENLRYLDTRNVTDMNSMFYNCWRLTSIDVSNFDTRNVTDMEDMFCNCASLTSLDVSSFNTENVTNMSGMFLGMDEIKYLDLSGFNTKKVTNMSAMFLSCFNLVNINLSSFDTRYVKYMQQMFEDCWSLIYIDLSRFATSMVEDMYFMFKGCESLYAVDLTHFNLLNVFNVAEMFSGCSQLRTIYCNNNWRIHLNMEDNDMFKDCISLIGSCGTRYSETGGGVGYARPDEPGDPGYFTPSAKRVGIYVNGEPVTGTVPNKYVSKIQDGPSYVSYNAEEGVLYMNNASLTTTGEGIFIPDAVTIRLSGPNRITSTGNGITMLSECYIEGSGSLSVFSSDGYGLSFSEGLITTGTGWLDIYGKIGALDGRPWTNYAGKVCYGYLDPNQEMLLRTDGEHPVVQDLGTIERGGWVMNYDTYSFASYYHTVVDKYSKESVTKPFTIVPKDKIEYYPVEIGGQRLNNYNVDGFSPMSLASGSVTFNTKFNILTLTDAKFVEYSPEDAALKVNLQDFCMVLHGDNSLVGNDKNNKEYYGITFGDEGVADRTSKRYWTVEGVDGPDGKPATLKISGTIYFESTDTDAEVTFKDVDIIDETEAYMWSQDYVDVIIDKCSFDLWDDTPSPYSIMDGLQSLTLEDCYFERGCYWSDEHSAVYNHSGNPESRYISIKRGEGVLFGDVNGDGIVDVADIASVINVMAGSANYKDADVNGDGSVDVADIATIINIMAGK